MEELFKFTLLLRGRTDYLSDRESERNERVRKAIGRQIENYGAVRIKCGIFSASARSNVDLNR
jgi:hypothetical protein